MAASGVQRTGDQLCWRPRGQGSARERPRRMPMDCAGSRDGPDTGRAVRRCAVAAGAYGAGSARALAVRRGAVLALRHQGAGSSGTSMARSPGAAARSPAPASSTCYAEPLAVTLGRPQSAGLYLLLGRGVSSPVTRALTGQPSHAADGAGSARHTAGTLRHRRVSGRHGTKPGHADDSAFCLRMPRRADRRIRRRPGPRPRCRAGARIGRFGGDLRAAVARPGSPQVMHQAVPQRSTQLRRRAHAVHPRGGAVRPETLVSCNSLIPLRSCPARPAP